MQFMIEPNVVNYFMLCTTLLTMAFGYYWYSLCYKKLECKSSERRFERCVELFRENSPMVNNCISTLLNLVNRIERDVTDYYRYTALCGFANKIFQPFAKLCGKFIGKNDRNVGTSCYLPNLPPYDYTIRDPPRYCGSACQWNEMFDESYNLRPGVCPTESPKCCYPDLSVRNNGQFYSAAESNYYVPTNKTSTNNCGYFTNLCNTVMEYLPLITTMVNMYMPKPVATTPAPFACQTTQPAVRQPKLDIDALMKGFNFDEIFKNIKAAENPKENSNTEACEPGPQGEKCVTEKNSTDCENKNVVEVNTDIEPVNPNINDNKSE